MSARARFEQQCEGRIARDIDLVDRVHLDGDIQGHRNSPGQNVMLVQGAWTGEFVKGAGASILTKFKSVPSFCNDGGSNHAANPQHSP
jgi:hypothetical protein